MGSPVLLMNKGLLIWELFKSTVQSKLDCPIVEPVNPVVVFCFRTQKSTCQDYKIIEILPGEDTFLNTSYNFV